MPSLPGKRQFYLRHRIAMKASDFQEGSLSPQEYADLIRQRLENGPPPTAILRLAAISTKEEQ